MNLIDIPAGGTVFVDTNILVYAFAPEPNLGRACAQFLNRIELQEIAGATSSQVLSDVAHRLMTLEACATFNGPYAGIAARMQGHPAEIQQLGRFRRAVEDISLMGVRVKHFTVVPSELFGFSDVMWDREWFSCFRGSLDS